MCMIFLLVLVCRRSTKSSSTDHGRSRQITADLTVSVYFLHVNTFYIYSLCLVFVNLILTSHQGRGNFNWEITSVRLAWGGFIFLVGDWYRKALITGGRDVLGPVVLACTRGWEEPASGTVSSVSLRPRPHFFSPGVPTPTSFSDGYWPESIRWNNPFFPDLFLVSFLRQ